MSDMVLIAYYIYYVFSGIKAAFARKYALSNKHSLK